MAFLWHAVPIGRPDRSPRSPINSFVIKPNRQKYFSKYNLTQLFFSRFVLQYCYFVFQVTVDEIHELVSNQEETDTRVVLYLNYAVKLGYKSAVVRSPDTDIFFILLHYAHSIALTIYLDIGSGKHRQLINVTEISESMGAAYCTTLLGLYVFTGEDVTSAFKGKGKVGPLKKLQKHAKYQDAFR